METTRPDRRLQRSERPEHALAYLLESTRRGQRLRSVALADGMGLLVAGAGSARDCDELAAWAPLLLGEGQEGSPEGGRRGHDDAPPISGIRVKGFDAFLCAQTEDGSEAELGAVAASCTRILRSRAA